MKPDPVTGLKPYTGIFDCAAKIYKTEGLASFWKVRGPLPWPSAVLFTLSRGNAQHTAPATQL
jgi:hypothetical protein